MRNIWNFHNEVQNKEQQTYRVIRVMDDLQRSIQFFNKTNINAEKITSISTNLTWKSESGENKQEYEYNRKGLSERNNIHPKRYLEQTHRSKEQKQVQKRQQQQLFAVKMMQKEDKLSSNEGNIGKKSIQEGPKERWRQKGKEKQKQKISNNINSRVSLFSIRQIKGVVFRERRKEKIQEKKQRLSSVETQIQLQLSLKQVKQK